MYLIRCSGFINVFNILGHR